MIVNANSVHIPLPDNSVQCVVTSPPYWGLRKYDGAQDYKWDDGWTGGLGLEPTPEMFIDHMVQIFREVKRVLRDDGVAWVNMGDCYAQNKGTMRGDNETSAKAIHRQMLRGTSTGQHGGWEGRASRAANTAIGNLKPKDLVMMPHRLALALQADGWWVRSDVIWAKPNPMPESVNGWRWEQCKDCTGCDKCKDNNGLVLRRGSWRPTSSHEHIFMLAKSSMYYSDGEAVREKNTFKTKWNEPNKRHLTRSHGNSELSTKTGQGFHRVGSITAGRNLRNVWHIPTAPYKGAHYATFPPELARRCVLSSTSRHACSKCGMAWSRYDESYMPSCQCDAGTKPCVVLDVFAGSGTVGQVCRELPYQRDFVGLDISYEYLHGQALLRSERITTKASLQELPMFADDNGGK